MKKIILSIIICFLSISTAFSNELENCNVENTMAIVNVGADAWKDFLGFKEKNNATRLVGKEVVATIKERYAIDIEKEIDQIGFIVVKGNDGSYNPIFYIGGEFNPKSIVPALKKIISDSNNSSKADTLNILNRKIQTLNTANYKLVLFSKSLFLLCTNEVFDKIKNGQINFLNTPNKFTEFMASTDTFAYLTKETIEYLGSVPQVAEKNPYLADMAKKCSSLSVSLTERATRMVIEIMCPSADKANEFKSEFDNNKEVYLAKYEEDYAAFKNAMNNKLPDEFLLDFLRIVDAAKMKTNLMSLDLKVKGKSIILESPFERKMLLIPVAGIGAALVIPNFVAAKNNAKISACFHNQRVLTGAIEMYNMDNTTMMSDDFNMDRLVAKHYLRSKVTCPDNGSYSVVGSMIEDGYINCSVHGSALNHN